MALNTIEKDTLDIICDAYNKLKSSDIYFEDTEIPSHIHSMLTRIINSLAAVGYISDAQQDISGGLSIELTSDGIEYCKRLMSFRNRPNALSKESERLLENLLAASNLVELAQYKFENITDNEDMLLRGAFKELEDRQFISTLWGGDVPAELIITKAGHDYIKNKREFVEMKVVDNVSNTTTPKNVEKNRVFIVHGRDNSAKSETARFVERLGLDALILNEQPGKGQTIIEKIEENSDVGFAIILYTPCDEGKLKDEPVELKNRARQNVVFEHGYFCAKIGRTCVAALVKGDVEKPSDISGIEYIPMDDAGAWKYQVAREMKAAGYSIDMNKI